MKTPLFLPNDSLPLILLYDLSNATHKLFDHHMGNIWFDYELIALSALEEAIATIEKDRQQNRVPDLVFVSDQSWNKGGGDFVRLLRQQQGLETLPIYRLAACSAGEGDRLCNGDTHADESEASCECMMKYFGDSNAYQLLMQPDHPMRIDGVFCCGTLRSKINGIVSRMAEHWFA